MPITLRQAPPGALDALRHGFAGVRHDAESFARGAPEAEAEAAAPHPVYSVDVEDLARGRLLGAAMLVGWRYLILEDEDAVAVGTVMEEEEGELELAALDQGRLVGLSLESIAAAESAEAVSSKDYELRYLEILPLYFTAIWLHAEDDDLLVPLDDHADAGVSAHGLHTEETILKMLQSQLERHEPAPEWEV